MAMEAVVAALLLLVVCLGQVTGQSDLECLREFSKSVTDPEGNLKEWTDSSSTRICNAFGVQCLHPSEVKVYSLSLPGVGLSGSFPQGLEKCTSLTGLDLSGNSFTGPIPDTICKMLPYLVKLDLSENQIGGTIPHNLGSCMYLNELHLQQNELQGSLPGEIGILNRLNDFNVSNNRLAGEIPGSFVGRAFPSSSFQGNSLCGPPVKNCGGGGGANVGLIAGVSVGGVVVILVIAGLIARTIFARRSSKGTGGAAAHDSRWVEKIKAPRTVTVSMFEKPLVRIRLSDLMAATNNFSKENVIGWGASGVSYKATLRDGSVLAVKRLDSGSCARTEQQFRTEMERLGNVRHSNLVPLLGYCLASSSERLLVYKHMSNGSLWDWLHGGGGNGERLEWPARLKIALGTARGLAFLHHCCNPKILHRNINPKTILLDDDLEARITDFGVARLIAPPSTTSSSSSSSSAAAAVNADVVWEMGEEGYVAPEYARIPLTTTKGDVYSFGVVLLELLTSQKPVDISIGQFKGSLVEWVGILYNSGRVAEALDKSLLVEGKGEGEGEGESEGEGEGDGNVELVQALKVACSCVLVLPKDRPSMYQVFNELRKLGERYKLSDPDDDLPLITVNGQVDGDNADATQLRQH